MPPVKKTWSASSAPVRLGVLGLLACLAGTAPAETIVAPAGLPLYFEANQGQAVSSANFIARGSDSQFLISPTGAQIVLRKAGAGPAALRMQFIGADARAQICGDAQLAGKINYLTGNDPARWKTGVPTFAAVRVADLYPGISLRYYGNHRQLEYDFTVAPGADPRAIRIHIEGADKLSFGPGGELVLALPGGEIRQPVPVIYQLANGARREIGGGYRILDAHTVAFTVNQYDPRLPLVIDPILGYSTYFGGNGYDTAWAVAVDTNGFVYVAGQTTSTQFAPGKPFATPGAFQTNYAGGGAYGDAFVAKFDNLGTNLIYLTYLGGSADDAALALAVDSSGDAYVAGATDSPNFPVKNAIYTNISGTIDPYQHGYLSDAFVAELNPGGSNLVYSTYLGGEATDVARGIAVDAVGNAYVAGYTYSTNFPTTSNAFQKHLAVTNSTYQRYYNGNAFVTEISAGGSNLLYSSYLGGTNLDQARSVALGVSNCVYVAGYSGSPNFPTTNYIHQFIGTNLVDGHRLNGMTNEYPGLRRVRRQIHAFLLQPGLFHAPGRRGQRRGRLSGRGQPGQRLRDGLDRLHQFPQYRYERCRPL